MHERYRRQTDDRQTDDRRQTDGRQHIANVNASSRSLMNAKSRNYDLITFINFPSPCKGAKYCNLRWACLCLFVCLSLRPLAYFKDHTTRLHQISCTCYLCRGLVLLWRQCNTLCTSGFVDNVMFAHNGPCDVWLIGHIPRVTQQGEHRGRSVMSMVALFRILVC